MLYYPQEDQVQTALPNPPESLDDAPIERSSDVLFTATIKAKESPVKVWTDSVEVISATHSGAGFYAGHECFVGQLISLLMPMPSELRRFDQDKKLYKIWGLVQHCSPLTGDALFHVGVAFIGRSAPAGYADKPLTSYRVSGVDREGFWAISETDKPFRMRKYFRFWSASEVTLTVMNTDGSASTTERAVTENISESGACVFSDLLLSLGDRINFTSAEFNFNATSMVRDRRNGGDKRSRLHLEFVDALFPVDKIHGAISQSGLLDQS